MRDIPSFDATLDEVEHPAPDADLHEDRTFVARLRASIPALEEEATPGGAGAYLWDHAVAWVPEPEILEPPPPAPPAPPPSGELTVIARELALSEAANSDELNRLRRRFAWENHPDRHPNWPQNLANRRVAIANMLIDRALDSLAHPKRSK